MIFPPIWYHSEWFVAQPGWKKRVNGRISLLVDLTGLISHHHHLMMSIISVRQVIGWGVQPREPGDEREGFRWVATFIRASYLYMSPSRYYHTLLVRLYWCRSVCHWPAKQRSGFQTNSSISRVISFFLHISRVISHISLFGRLNLSLRGKDMASLKEHLYKDSKEAKA